MEPDLGFDWRRAFRALRALQRDPDDSKQVYVVLEALAGSQPRHLLAVFTRDVHGRRLLRERSDLAARLSERALLRTMPVGSVAHGYLDVDYVVVGSGAGGATAAVTLARAGAQVAVVEAGPWRDPQDYPSTGYGMLRDMVDGWGANFTRGRAFWPVVQSALVGGTTVINSAICVRTPADVFETWKRVSGIGGPALAEQIWELQAELEADLQPEVVPAAALGRNNLLAAGGATALGYPHAVMTRYTTNCRGSGNCVKGCRADRKQSLNRNFIPEVLARGGTVLSCAPVHKVFCEHGRARSVVGRFRHPQSKRRGAAFEVRARYGVLVAASVTGSPALLARSGVRNRALGTGFQTHLCAPVLGCYDDVVDMHRAATQGWASVAFRETLGVKLETQGIPLEMLAGQLPGGGSALMDSLSKFRHIATWSLACRSQSVGSVRCGWSGRPQVHFTPSPEDMRRFREGIYQLARTHVAAGARAVVPSIRGLPCKLAPNEIEHIRAASLDPRDYVAILSHLFGGCVMGMDPKRSVCDAGGRVHGYENLFVSDPSVFPTNIGVNPQHSIMAMARYWTRHAVLNAPNATRYQSPKPPAEPS